MLRAPSAVEQDLERDALGAQLTAPAPERAAQHGDRVALGVDRATVEGAEPAVVARGPTVVGHAVGAGRRAVRVVSERRGRGRGQGREVHVGARWHRIRTAAPRGERVAGVVAGHADRAFGLRVERLELVVVERPVGDLGTLDRPQLRREAEVDLAVARQLPVGVETGAADRRGHVVEIAGGEPLAVGRRAPVGARLEQRVRTEEVAPGEFDLVVRQVAEPVEGRHQREEVVAALLEDADRLPGGGEHVGRGGTSRPGTDHDDVELRHR